MAVAQNVRTGTTSDPETPRARALAEAQRQTGVYRSAQRFLLVSSVIGLALPFVFGAQASSVIDGISVAAAGVGIALASMAVGGLFGFIFGIPTTLQGNRLSAMPPDERTRPLSRSQYTGNTSLEQISDWLTKILVGVGLTQLSSVPAGLTAVGSFLAGGLGGLPGAEVFATVLFVFALLNGFFVSYLWARLQLLGLFAASEVVDIAGAAETAGLQEGQAQGLAKGRQLNQKRPAIDSAAPSSNIEEAEPVPAGLPIRALWVDDNPDNNVTVRQVLHSYFGVDFDLAESTDEAMGLLQQNKDRYAFVITDMSRDRDRRAGYTLLNKMGAPKNGPPTIIYAGRTSPELESEARRNGAFALTTSPNQLTDLVGQIVERRVASSPIETGS